MILTVCDFWRELGLISVPVPGLGVQFDASPLSTFTFLLIYTGCSSEYFTLFVLLKAAYISGGRGAFDAETCFSPILV